jgi:hypothetical protein
MNPGDKLSNGAILIASDKNTQGDTYVLAIWYAANTPYVTWYAGQNGGYYSGHYHTNISSAVEDFKERLSF